MSVMEPCCLLPMFTTVLKMYLKCRAQYRDPNNCRRTFWNTDACGQTCGWSSTESRDEGRQKNIAFTTATFLDYGDVVLFIPLLFRYDPEISPRNCSSCTCPAVHNGRLQWSVFRGTEILRDIAIVDLLGGIGCLRVKRFSKRKTTPKRSAGVTFAWNFYVSSDWTYVAVSSDLEAVVPGRGSATVTNTNIKVIYISIIFDRNVGVSTKNARRNAVVGGRWSSDRAWPKKTTLRTASRGGETSRISARTEFRTKPEDRGNCRRLCRPICRRKRGVGGDGARAPLGEHRYPPLNHYCSITPKKSIVGWRDNAASNKTE